ncbi:MAG TPA: xylulokinase [Blastocatellia bacterium]|nr:xylulokinase [Blastocatellia bacterium]
MYLGIDLGTSEVKTILLDADHTIAASAGVRLEVSRPEPSWSEQDPADWWTATCQAVGELSRKAESAFRRIRAIGLSGQMHGAVLLDESNHVLRPAILWNDTRSAAECQEMMKALPALTGIAGNLAMPGFTAPKILWVKKHEPEIYKRIARVLLPKDYLRFRMTGAHVSEMSDAAGTLWLDVAARDWSDDLLNLTGLTRKAMPGLVEGSQPSGSLSQEVAAAWGLPEPVVVAGGGGDNAASAVGIGAVKPGDGFISLGTSGVIFLVTDKFRPNPESAVHAFCHALPDRWHQMSVMLSAASCLRWITELVGFPNETELIGKVEVMSESVRLRAPLFLPYLGGERTPHNNVNARGVFFGLENETNAASLGYSVLEGVTFGMADGLAALKAAGARVESLGLVGGGARSPFWAGLHATVLGLPVKTLAGGEAGGALGAARLAWLADGGLESEVCRPPDATQVFEPNQELGRKIALRYDRFKQLYQVLRPMFDLNVTDR